VIRLQTFILLVVVATLGLAGAIAIQPGSAALAVDVYLFFVGTLGLLLAIARTLGTLPREHPTRLDAGARGPGRQTRPRELVKLEREVALSTETAFDTYYRLRPAVRRIAESRLALRGIDLDAPSGPAAELLGPETWDLVRADRPRPRDHIAPGMPLDRIAAVVASVEEL
jgi:hypothetical protein